MSQGVHTLMKQEQLGGPSKRPENCKWVARAWKAVKVRPSEMGWMTGFWSTFNRSVVRHLCRTLPSEPWQITR